MLVSQFIESDFPRLSVLDKVSFALQMMEDYDLLDLPVVLDDKFSGIISKDDLLDADDTVLIGSMHHHFIKASVLPDDHFLNAVKVADRFQVSVAPVINKAGELQGIIRRKSLLHTLSIFCDVETPGGMIVLEMDKRNFSFGEISRLVETNDAHITQLNSYTEPSTGLFIVSIKTNKVEISDIVATLQRYDYTIRFYFGEEHYENELKENYDLLMTYLRM